MFFIIYHIYFHPDNSDSEMDFVTQSGSLVVAIEVKSELVEASTSTSIQLQLQSNFNVNFKATSNELQRL